MTHDDGLREKVIEARNAGIEECAAWHDRRAEKESLVGSRSGEQAERFAASELRALHTDTKPSQDAGEGGVSREEHVRTEECSIFEQVSRYRCPECKAQAGAFLAATPPVDDALATAKAADTKRAEEEEQRNSDEVWAERNEHARATVKGECRRDWVKCPICDEPDMLKLTDKDGNALIQCVNYGCASNREPVKAVPVSGEVVAWGLIFSEKLGVNAPTTFKTEAQAAAYAAQCSRPTPRVVPLFAHPSPDALRDEDTKRAEIEEERHD